MVEPNRFKEIKEIIEYLKQNQNKHLSSAKRSSIPSTTSQHEANNYKFQHQTESILNEHKPKVSLQNNTQILHRKLNQPPIYGEVGCSKERNVCNIKITNKSDQIISGEIIRRTNKNYSQKQNNKRLKINQKNNERQSYLTEFYSVSKPVDNPDNNRKCNSDNQFSCEFNEALLSKSAPHAVDKSEKHLGENENSHSFILNSDSNTSLKRNVTSVRNRLVPQVNNLCSTQSGSSKLEEKTFVNLLSTKKETQQSSLVDKQRTKVTTSPNKYNRKWTFDEICDKFIAERRNKLEQNNTKTSENEPNSFSKDNTFLKSFSSGNIFLEKEKTRDTNSAPVTNFEVKDVKKQLEYNKAAIDDYFYMILKRNSKVSGNEANDLEESEVKIVSIESQQLCDNKPMGESNKNSQMYKFDRHVINTTANKGKSNVSHIVNLTEYSQDNLSSSDINGNVETKKFLHDSEKEDSVIETENIGSKEGSIEKFYGCIGRNIQTGTCLENSSKSQTDLLDNLERPTLTAAYKKLEHKNIEESGKNMKTDELESFLKNIITRVEKKECNKSEKPPKTKFFIKKYKKGETKIYKLKKLRKKILVIKENNEGNLHDLLKKVTGDECKFQTRLTRYESGSSISTSSSYSTDDTESETLSTGSKELTAPQQRLRTAFNELSKDKSLCYSQQEWEDVPELTKDEIKMKIQDYFFKIYENLKKNKPSHFRHRRQSYDNCVFKDERLQLKPPAESLMTVISSGAQKSKAKFHLMLYILEKIQTLLETDTKLTKRGVYYQLKTLINDQRESDRAINSISCLLDVGMWALNIIAQKGLVFGNLKLMLSSGEILNCNVPGTLIPQDINDIVEVHSSAYFILVVEKESVFQKLIEEDLPNKLTRPFIMITGKGFPDLNTQLFLKKLWMVMSIPVFILVDADPHGINIMLNYRFGSVNNAHVSQHLAVPKAKWLGIYPSEVINLNITRQPLNEKEIKLVNSILKTPYMDFSPRLVDELKVLLTKKFKAGIEGLIKTDTYLSDVYLPNKFFAHNFI